MPTRQLYCETRAAREGMPKVMPEDVSRDAVTHRGVLRVNGATLTKTEPSISVVQDFGDSPHQQLSSPVLWPDLDTLK